MKTSASIGNLVPALRKAQAGVGPVYRNKANPYFKSRYADLGAVADAVAEVLDANGLCVVQMPISTAEGVGVETTLFHDSGEWISDSFVLPLAKVDPQGGGSCITYARRYALMGLLAIAPEDDDGNAAAEAQRQRKAPEDNGSAPPKPRTGVKLRDESLEYIESAANRGMDSLEKAWKKLDKTERSRLQPELRRLKRLASQVMEGA